MIAHGRPGPETTPPMHRWARAISHHRLDSCPHTAERRLPPPVNAGRFGECGKPPTPTPCRAPRGPSRPSEPAASNRQLETPVPAAHPPQMSIPGLPHRTIAPASHWQSPGTKSVCRAGSLWMKTAAQARRAQAFQRRRKIQLAPSATRKAGSAVMTGQSTSASSRRPWCAFADSSRSEWMFAETASPNAPSAAPKATCRAAERGGFRSRKRS